MNNRVSVVWASSLGFLSVAIGAFGAHALKNTLEPAALQILETGVRYQMMHALALLGCAHFADGKLLGWSRRLFVVGILIFCGSLYILALGGPRWMGAVAPLGGSSLMAGWLLLLAHAASFGKRKRT